MADNTCTVPGCGRPWLARGWCAKHYQRWQKHGDANYAPPAFRLRAGGKPTVFVTVGQRFGRWVVADPESRVYGGRRGALVKCSCPRGTEKAIALADLFSGNSQSCGCLRNELTIKRNRTISHASTHGMSGHPLFHTWKAMVSRCTYPSDKDWPKYGARGIRVCDAWYDTRAFIAWIEENLGPRPEGRYPSGRSLYTLDRIDNDGHYEPGNVRWATALQQGRNKRTLPWKRCSCGTRSPGKAKFCCACGAALPESMPALPAA